MNSSSGRERMPDMLSSVDCVVKVAISGCKVSLSFVEGIKTFQAPMGVGCSASTVLQYKFVF
jgi:hypothetical protein